MTGRSTAGAPGVGEHQAGDIIPASTRYPYLHMIVEWEIDAAYADGVADGEALGWAAGWTAGFAQGFMAPDPPPMGTPAFRALERDAVRDALWPSADSLAEAVAAHLRDLERAERRRHHSGDYGVPHTGQTILGKHGEMLDVSVPDGMQYRRGGER